MECLYQAVNNGCDAVYLAGKSFGARKFAANFTNDELVDAIKYCHLYGVRVFVTMNTLVKNNEVDSFLEEARFLHKNGVDALIVQDFGMICLLREKFPNLEIHASTQANINSREVCELYYKLGVKRVVFARELSIDEIDKIDVPIEKEAFIHGALCISYSGNCLMSSMLGGRSGNRGECAGSCRMPYSLIKDDKVISRDKYLLSTKEFSSVYNIDRLLKSSVYSFKIEGRMKSPLYVGFITRLYRNLIDGKHVNLEEELNKLKTIFNREFTRGRLFLASDIDLMNTKSPNHIGLKIGKCSIKDNKIKIVLDRGEVLNQHDSIRFLNSSKGMTINYLYDSKLKLCSSATGICYVDNKLELSGDDLVHKTQDKKLEEEFEHIEKKKIPITFKIKSSKNNLLIEVSDGKNKFSKKIPTSIAINAPTTAGDIMKHLNKLGNSPFYGVDFDFDISDNIFVQIKEINEARRELVDELIKSREEVKTSFVEKDASFDRVCLDDFSKTVSCVVRTKEQLLKCLELNVDRIYVTDLELYDKYSNKNNVYYFGKNIRDKRLVSDYAIYNGVIGDYLINVTNIYTAYYLSKIGFKGLNLSVELSNDEVIDFIELFKEKFGVFGLEILVYGRVQNMLIKGNVLDLKSGKYLLEDFRKRQFPVYYDGCFTHIFNYTNERDIGESIKNICGIRLDFYDENSTMVEKIINSKIHI